MSPNPNGGLVTLLGVDPEGYTPHELHTGERSYHETNCYTDILIELIHARGAEPLAAMGFLVRMDFEGDQWTFFKPPPADLEQLYGIDIHEMQPHRHLPTQIAEQIRAGRTITVELDSWYLPDTEATAYRKDHVKTSVVIEGIDPAAERLRYFHNAGLYELDGEDYRGVFRIGGSFSGDVLPPYTELVRFDVRPPLDQHELRSVARELLAEHLALRPPTNPFERFGAQLAADLPALLEGDAADYHSYAFATVRMAGSAFEICADHVDWLLGGEGEAAAASMREIVSGCKLLSFKLARRRAFDTEPATAGLVSAWDTAMTSLDSLAPAPA
jgi:hypothetical protein